MKTALYLLLAIALSAQPTPKEALQRAIGTNTVTGSNLGVPFQVATLAALKAVKVANVATGQATALLGYTTAGDGGGGRFQYDSSSVAAPNDTTVVAPTVGNGRWLRISYDQSLGFNPGSFTTLNASGRVSLSSTGVSFVSGGTNYNQISVSGTGNASGSSDVRGLYPLTTITGANNVAFLNGIYSISQNSKSSGTVLGQGSITAATYVSGASNTTAMFGVASANFIEGSGNITASYEAFVVDPPAYFSTGRITGAIIGYSIPLDIGNVAASSVTGFQISNQTKGIGGLYGFRGGITSGSERYNLFMDGSAPNYLAGNLILGAAYIGSVQSLSGAGAANVTTETTALTTTGASQAITLADGVAGQTKIIIHAVDGGSAILTPTTKTGFSTVTFTNAGESVTLKFLTTQGWIVTGSYLAVIAP